MSSIIMDTETTGLTKPSFVGFEEQPRIIEFAAIFIDHRGEIFHTIDELFNPECKISDEIIKGFGWDESELAKKRLFKEFIPELRDKFYSGTELIGHNLLFDRDMLSFELDRAACDFFPWPESLICTVQEYRHLFGFRPNLKQLYEKIVGKELDWKHRALDDAMAVYEILKKEGWWNA